MILDKIKLYTIKILIIVLFCFISINKIEASMIINEIMYDLSGGDADREWVEVYNNGNEAVDFSKWFFFSNNTKHSLVPESLSTIPASGYAVIVQKIDKFKTDWPNYNGLIFDSSWTSFNNENDTISLKDPDLNIVSEVSFNSGMGANGNGDSLQRNSSNSFVGASPTPGSINSFSNTNTDTNTNVNNDNDSKVTTSSNTSNSTVKKLKEVSVPQITSEIIAEKNIFVGVPTIFKSYVLGLDRQPLFSGKLIWNFGDGIILVKDKIEPVIYKYKYEGEYVVTLDYYQNPIQQGPSSTDRLIIKVNKANLFINRIGDIVDPFIEIENKSSIEVSLSYWILSANNKNFIIPNNTYILPNKKLIFSSEITHFSLEDLNSINLLRPNGEIEYSFNQNNNTHTKYIPIKNTNSLNQNYNSNQPSNILPEENNVIDLRELNEANVLKSNISSNNLYIFGLIFLILFGSVILFINKKKKTLSKDDISMLNENDIRIIE